MKTINLPGDDCGLPPTTPHNMLPSDLKKKSHGPGIISPNRRILFGTLDRFAKARGFFLAVYGSTLVEGDNARDFDLVAVPLRHDANVLGFFMDIAAPMDDIYYGSMNTASVSYEYNGVLIDLQIRLPREAT